MTVEEIAEMTQMRIANLLSLRSRLTDQIAWQCSRNAEWGRRHTYDQWQTWLEGAVLDRDYMAIAIST